MSNEWFAEIQPRSNRRGYELDASAKGLLLAQAERGARGEAELVKLDCSAGIWINEEEYVNDSNKLEALRWLAETHRNHALTGSPAPASYFELAESTKRLNQRVSYIDSDIRYEPRALAVSDDLNTVVIGTKAGEIILLERVEEGREWKPRELESFSEKPTWKAGEAPPESEAGIEALRAIRGLCFVDDQTVIACRGVGEFIVLTKNNEQWENEGQVVSDTDSSNIGPAQARRMRVRRLLPLAVRGEDMGPVAIAFTGESETFVLLRMEDRTLEVRQQSLHTLFEKDNDGISRDLLDVNIGDAAKVGDFLWFLTAAGRLLRCTIEMTHDSVRFARSSVWRVMAPFQQPEFRRLVSCEYGLAVLAANGATFLRFSKGFEEVTLECENEPTREDSEATPSEKFLRPTWISVQDAIDCSVCLPFEKEGDCSAGTTGGALSHQRVIAKENPVWVAVATLEPGLRWLSWYDQERETDSRETHVSVAGTSTKQSVGGDNDRVMLLAFGARRGGKGEALLASATWDHHAIVSTILDRTDVLECLKSEFGDILDQYAQDSDDGVGMANELSSPGIAYWVLMRRIEHDLGQGSEMPNYLKAFDPLIDRSSVRTGNPRRALFDALSLLEGGDLRRMGKKVIFSYKRQSGASSETDEKVHELRVWVLRILARSYELGTDLGRGIAEGIYSRIADLVGHSSGSRNNGNELYLFADFLQKWFVRGHTYGEKGTGLLHLLRYNFECDRGLDSLAYLAPLIHRRVDTKWVASHRESGPGDAVVDLVHISEHGVVVSSHVSGAIRLTNQDGESARWSDERGLFPRIRLLVKGEGTVMEREDSKEFAEQYRQGPYARKLFVENGEDGSYLLVFSILGWRVEDQEEGNVIKSPSLYAVHLEWCADWNAMKVLGAHQKESESELYAITKAESSAGTLRLFVGTEGTWDWRSPDDKAANWRRQPIIEAQVHLPPRFASDAKGPLAIDLNPISVKRLYYDERSVPTSTPTLPHTVQNACLSLAIHKQDGEIWLWAGYNDGQIQCFHLASGSAESAQGVSNRSSHEEWEERNGVSCEGGTNGLLGSLQLDVKKLNNLSAISELKYFEDAGVLAFGTRGGLVAAIHMRVDWNDEDGKAPSLRSIQQSSSEWNHESEDTGLQILRNTDGVWPFLIHTELSSGIRGIDAYEDEERSRLLVTTEDGLLTVFSLDPPSTDMQGSRRPPFPGGRLDRIQLPHMAKSIAVFSPATIQAGPIFDHQAPQLMIGDENGDIHRHDLSFPRNTARRRRQAIDLLFRLKERDRNKEAQFDNLGLSTTPHLKNIVGAEWMRDWLRVIDVGNDYLLRYALWAELYELQQEISDKINKLDEGEKEWVEHKKARKSPSASANGAAGRFSQGRWTSGRAKALFELIEQFRERLNARAEELFRKSPSRRGPSRIIWEEGSKVVNRLAESLLTIENKPQLRKAAQEYLKTVRVVDDLCNRWTGAKQSEESRVLALSFAEIFDWPLILLLGGRRRDDCLEEVRSYAINKLVNRRLNFAQSEMLPLETMRVINQAIFRAVLKVGKMPPPMNLTLKFDTSGESEPSVSAMGLHDLVVLVGDLAQRNSGVLTLASALRTELYRFFGLCLLLIPKNAAVIGQMASESRLMEDGPEAKEGVLAHAEFYLNSIEGITGEDATRKEDWITAMARFAAYAANEKREHHGQADVYWLFLRQVLDDQKSVREAFTDLDLVSEYDRVMDVACVLSRLESKSTASADERDALEWLEKWKGIEGFGLSESHWKERSQYRFFAHSVTFLKELSGHHEVICESLQRRDEGRQRLKEAIGLCEKAQAFLDNQPGLFEPQRSQFRAIIDGWRREIDSRGQDSETILRLLRGFNRHVYRSDADHQIAAATELARQVAPVWYDEKRDAKIQRIEMELDLESHPLLSKIVATAKRMVDNTHLSGTLLAVAEKALEPRRLDLERTPLDRIGQIMTEAALWRGLSGFEWDHSEEELSEYKPPGSQAVWEVICNEVAQNVLKYCARNSDGREDEGVRGNFSVHTDEKGKTRCELELFGTVPFLKGLADEFRPTDGDDPLAVLMCRAKDAKREGKQFGPFNVEKSSGMGLYFLSLIAKYSDMDMETRLARDKDGEQTVESALAVMIGWGGTK